MQILQSVITVILIATCGSLVTIGIHSYNAKKESRMKKDSFVMQIPTYLIIILLVVSVILAVIIVLIVFLANIKDILIFIPIVSVIFLLFVYGDYVAIREKLFVSKDEVIYIPPFGKKKKYNFSMFKKVVSKSNSYGMIFYSVYTEKKVFSFTSLYIGYRLLVSEFEKKGIKITYK